MCAADAFISGQLSWFLCIKLCRGGVQAAASRRRGGGDPRRRGSGQGRRWPGRTGAQLDSACRTSSVRMRPKLRRPGQCAGPVPARRTGAGPLPSRRPPGLRAAAGSAATSGVPGGWRCRCRHSRSGLTVSAASKIDERWSEGDRSGTSYRRGRCTMWQPGHGQRIQPRVAPGCPRPLGCGRGAAVTPSAVSSRGWRSWRAGRSAGPLDAGSVITTSSPLPCALKPGTRWARRSVTVTSMPEVVHYANRLPCTQHPGALHRRVEDQASGGVLQRAPVAQPHAATFGATTWHVRPHGQRCCCYPARFWRLP